MKRITLLIIIITLIMSIASCGQPVTQDPATPTATQAATPALTQAAAAPTATVTPAPTATATPAPTPSPTPAPTPSPTPAPKPKKTKAPAPPSGLVIIAAANNSTSEYGEIRGGYYNGKWLTHREAAAYCEGKMTFYEYDLTRLKRTVVSSGVTHEEEDDSACETNDGFGCYWLDIPEDVAEGDSADDGSFGYTYLYSGGKLPDIEAVEDTEEACLAVQTLLDNALGEGEAEVELYNAVSADIDNDGEKEIAADVYSDTACLWCVIENDGTVKTFDDDYLESTYYMDAYLQNIIDIDRDGMSELVIGYCWGDDQGMWVFKYDGNKLTLVLDYWVWSNPGT